MIVVSEGWESGTIPAIWTQIDQADEIQISTTGPYAGSYALSIQLTSALRYPRIRYVFDNHIILRGYTVTVKAWVRDLAAARHFEVIIEDGGPASSLTVTRSGATQPWVATAPLSHIVSATSSLLRVTLGSVTNATQIGGEWNIDDIVITTSVPSSGTLPVAPEKELPIISPQDTRQTRLLQWPFGLRAYGPGIGSRDVLPLALPRPWRKPWEPA